MGVGILTLAVRIAQIIFAIIVLALPTALIKGMGPVFYGETGDKAPALIDYGVFCGGAGLVIALFRVAAAFIESLQGIIIMALDALTAVFLLAGGIAYAVTIKVGSCGDVFYLSEHQKTFAPSLMKSFGYSLTDKTRGQWERDMILDIRGRCRMVQAETAFLWFLFAAFLATAALGFMSRSRGSTVF